MYQNRHDYVAEQAQVPGYRAIDSSMIACFISAVDCFCSGFAAQFAAATDNAAERRM
jgi:hypothetical protein